MSLSNSNNSKNFFSISRAIKCIRPVFLEFVDATRNDYQLKLINKNTYIFDEYFSKKYFIKKTDGKIQFFLYYI